MGIRTKDITGLKVGYLLVEEFVCREGRKSLWRAKCICGETVIRPSSTLLKMAKQGVGSSCGCKRRGPQKGPNPRNTIHGMRYHPAYQVWANMRARCKNPRHQMWHNYGGRGIQVCKSWDISFENFWEDMESGYQSGLTLERYDNDGDYEPGNCLWATHKIQGSNKRNNVHVDTPDGRMIMAEAARYYGINRATISYRISRGWPTDKVFSKVE